VHGARFKGDVRGKFCFYTEGGGCLELAAGGEVVEADTIVTFKGRLDKYMNRMWE